MCVCGVTLSGGVKLLRQQLIAAAHAADGRQLRFSHKHPQGAGSQVSTRVQADHDGVLEFWGEKREGKKRERTGAGEGGEERRGWRSMVKFIDDDALAPQAHAALDANSSCCDGLVILGAAVGISLLRAAGASYQRR